jgi:exonuclease VII small subunit
MTPTEAERLTRLETRLETIEEAIMKLDMKLDAWQSHFVSKEMLEDKLRLRDERLDRLEREKATHKNVLPMWVAVGISLVSVVLSYFSHK